MSTVCLRCTALCQVRQKSRLINGSVFPSHTRRGTSRYRSEGVNKCVCRKRFTLVLLSAAGISGTNDGDVTLAKA